jgi:HAD superfamily hydrolase (TIGR01509 family)
MRMELLIFDCDGVLVDSEFLANELLAEMMTELGHVMTGAQAIPIFTGRSVTDVLALAEGILGRTIPRAVGERYALLLEDRLRSELKPIPGAREAVAALRCRRCVASSSSLKRIRLSLEVTGLAPFFAENIFSATQVAHGKPAPDLYLLAARTMAVAPERCLVVEDSIAGVTAAVSAGMTVIGFTGGAHATPDLAQKLKGAGAESILSAMSDLPLIVGGLLDG